MVGAVYSWIDEKETIRNEIMLFILYPFGLCMYNLMTYEEKVFNKVFL